ncbi:DUF5719 family protein [Nocardioides panaciterrulae]|uniref:Uncharacterized protein n=1 Tax=Nocardioides panaciterrulae TaxID=661492 RepID=A0A7Y9E4N8_9ACTN|nr:DUF5719 family protein [Nocardioides panaciterrulae]NYD40947.1 hypothetical protein [Nocardioides panaciterrulae]
MSGQNPGPTPSPTPGPTSGNRARRSARGRLSLDLVGVLAIVLPLVTLGAALLLHVDGVHRRAAQPTRTPLTSASIVCPAPLTGAPAAYLSTTRAGVEGKVALRSDDGRSSAHLAEGEVTTVRGGSGPLIATGTGDLAPGLVGARFGPSDHLAVTACRPTSPDQWFTGVGGAATHSSVLELVNPDAGPAVADVTVLGGTGQVDVAKLHGVSVAGHFSVQLDLSEVAPRRGDLALHVVSERGRIAASVLDGSDQLGGGAASQDWLAPQPAPTTDNYVLGLAPGSGTRILTLANDSEDEVRASIRFVTEDSVFAPEGVDEVRVPPQSATRVSLASALGARSADGVVGLEITSSAPVTATLRTLVGGDLSHSVAGPALRSGTSVIVPSGSKQVVVAGARGVGAVTVVARSASGRQLASTRTGVRPGRGAVVKVPARAALLQVTPQGTAVHAAVVVSGAGAAVIPLEDPVLNGLVPDVGPGLPR